MTKQSHTPVPKILPISERLYEMNSCGYCGVFMTEKVMKKLLKLSYNHQIEVQRVLSENIDELYEANWSLAYPNGVQTTVKFGLKRDVEHRISLFKSDKPIYLPEVYIGSGFDEQSKLVIKQIENETKAKGE